MWIFWLIAGEFVFALLFLLHISGLFDDVYCALTGHIWSEPVNEQSGHTLTIQCQCCGEIIYKDDRET